MEIDEGSTDQLFLFFMKFYFFFDPVWQARDREFRKYQLFQHFPSFCIRNRIFRLKTECDGFLAKNERPDGSYPQ